MFDPKQRTNGIYVFEDGDLIHIYRVHHGEYSKLPDSTYGNEVIFELENNYDNYKNTVALVNDLCVFGNDGEYVTVDAKAVEKLVNAALHEALNIIDNDAVLGELLYADIVNRTHLTDDGTATFFVEIMKGAMEAMQEPLDAIDMFLCHINENCDSDDLQEWYEKYILTDKQLFRRRYSVEFSPMIDSVQLSEFKQLFFFDNFYDYCAYVLLKFSTAKQQVRRCACCGGLFIPQNKKNTLYCDRVFDDKGRTCKQIAPKLMAKLKQQNDALLEEFERVRNKNYKRYERGSCKLEGQESEKDLTSWQY